ncbi:hypothetical protein UFOVP210_24 [uncultured Caudovirales phage]|uniref:Uncharacterized protein n=1 Tax=uncultured Caudovirales phage TaxID=2100421 RepID=A0A6J7WIM4_9CAUD|nr:hypothetical protein UFOVP210_24 [uncultured Caudovirales phage]
MTVRELIQSFMFAETGQDIHLDDVCIQVGEHYVPLIGWELVRVQKDKAGKYFPADKYDSIDTETITIVVVKESKRGPKDRTEE